MSKEAMRMALEALEDANDVARMEFSDENYYGEAINALRQALETDLARVGEVGVWGECEPQEEVEDGWCDWVCPKPVGYLMQCCDCGLIHEVDFRVVQYEPKPSEVYEVVDDHDLQAQMRLRRRDDISPKKPNQEPVAWASSLDFDDDDQEIIPAKNKGKLGTGNCDIPLYTAPKQWVGLMDEQVEDEWERITGHSIFGGDRSEGRAMYISPDEVIEFSRAIEAKLKEKNT